MPSAYRNWPALFPKQMHRYAPAMWLEAMFPEVDSLPCPKGQLAVHDWNVQVHCGEPPGGVSRHVIVSFARVLEQRITVRHQAREEALQVTAYLGVGILLDEQRRGS